MYGDRMSLDIFYKYDYYKYIKVQVKTMDKLIKSKMDSGHKVLVNQEHVFGIHDSDKYLEFFTTKEEAVARLGVLEALLDAAYEPVDDVYHWFNFEPGVLGMVDDKPEVFVFYDTGSEYIAQVELMPWVVWVDPT